MTNGKSWMCNSFDFHKDQKTLVKTCVLYAFTKADMQNHKEEIGVSHYDRTTNSCDCSNLPT